MLNSKCCEKSQEMLGSGQKLGSVRIPEYFSLFFFSLFFFFLGGGGGGAYDVVCFDIVGYLKSIQREGSDPTVIIQYHNHLEQHVVPVRLHKAHC